MNLSTPNLDLRDMTSKRDRGRKVERMIEKKSCCEQRGGEGRGRGWGLCRNADPFPRWPLWTFSLPTAGPKNRNVPRLSPFPTLDLLGRLIILINQQVYDAGSRLERSIHPGRGVFGTAHSRRMGVVSSALPGLSGEGGSTDVEEEEQREEENRAVAGGEAEGE
ncbi:hypothetical protein JOQ06_003693 [Pogonophryne albipinna]|uniref:Uncharacterized protein n=1 Tax=Pogonophryne albipinna TaxID=1090488 RepID=A0AAD6AHD7_9TELE|nr:hypothetical protein JOQ06_003693 [Pogonophryne albipinna]